MSNTPAINISDAESHVMEVLWRAPGPVVAEQVVVALSGSQHWQSATVKTLLNRLLKKGAIAARKDGGRFLYQAVLPREAWLAQESESLVQRLFGGRIAPLLAHFVRRRTLSPADVQELRKLVDALDEAGTAGSTISGEAPLDEARPGQALPAAARLASVWWQC